ncbi:MAG: polyphenol oxidase family protein [Gemmatimonadales bacterium]|nr:polyphenol oxidase family protein [Gemmatimonadales bacterium]
MSRVDELRLPGTVPLWEVPGWRERFGVVAGVTGRGEDPAHPFDLGLWTEQPVGTVMGRWRTFRAALPECPSAVMAHQVHGGRVLWHRDAPGGWTIHEGADGHATRTPGLLLLVTVADCVPVYLVAPTKGAIAMLHAGWRGTAAGIVANGLALLAREADVSPDEVVLHAGVAISGPCYEVGAEVMTGVGRQVDGPGPWHLDLREILLEQAARLGLAEATASGLCSSARRDAFFSHRGSGGRDGRMVAYLGLVPTAP